MKKFFVIAALAFAMAAGVQQNTAEPCGGGNCVFPERTPVQAACNSSECATPEPAPVQVA
jgi:hypothetical protein